MKSDNRDFTILLVDDRPENNMLLQELLSADNRRFISVNSGNDALKAALKHPEIGLIMLDVQMPEMDGFEVARLLQSNAKTRDTSIIFVTAINKDEQYVLQGFEEGAVDYLSKPLDANVTRAKVNVFERLYFAQQEVKHSMGELEKINKQLEKFVYMVAHDLKSPLASIITILSTVKNNQTLDSDPKLQHNLEVVSLSAYELADMIEAILKYSLESFSQQATEEVDTNELVNQVVFLLSPPRHVKVQVADDLPVLKTRKHKLKQVFQNLISNSIKYNDKTQATIEVGTEEKEDSYLFYVKDNGPGIAAEDTQRIFKLFETTSNKATIDSSTGVGLNILKIIVEEQGGKIWVESEVGIGSTFYFEWKK